jgi:hypothetical protein
VNALWTDPVNTGITFGIILAGIPAYLAWRWWTSRRLEELPELGQKVAADERS